MARDYDWVIIPGDKEVRVFEYNDANGASINLTGKTVEAKVRITLTDEELTLLAEITNPPTDGLVQVTITEAQTEHIAQWFNLGATFNVRIVEDERTLVHGSIHLDGDES